MERFEERTRMTTLEVSETRSVDLSDTRRSNGPSKDTHPKRVFVCLRFCPIYVDQIKFPLRFNFDPLSDPQSISFLRLCSI